MRYVMTIIIIIVDNVICVEKISLFNNKKSVVEFNYIRIIYT